MQSDIKDKTEKPNLLEIQIRISAVKFAKRWNNEKKEASEKQTFWNEFFTMFKRDRVEYAEYEKYVKTPENNSGRGSIDAFWPGVLLIEHKSRGENLDKAIKQAEEYFIGITKESDIPKYIMVCDFYDFIFFDLLEDKKYRFNINELKDNIHLFMFMWKDDNNAIISPDIPVNRRASGKMGEIYDELRNANYNEKDMEYLLTRLTFCMFAEDVGIFDKKQFSNYISKNMQPGATELGPKLMQLFEILNRPKKDRMTTLNYDLKSFEYINGGLFEHNIDTPSFTVSSRKLLQEATSFDWKDISPEIFGSLFQSVMNKTERRTLGAHYTSEENIMKVIRPLFLDDLYEEFNDSIGNNIKLKTFHKKLANLTFFDPACGAGNFLIIAYREIRRLETELLWLLHGENKLLDIDGLSQIDVNQFYGIEINKFSQTIAQTALWMMDHLMNIELGERLGDTYARIPIKQSPHIVCGDALELDWNDILPSERCSFIFGNPPFIGAKVMDLKQKEQLKKITSNKNGFRALDYVAAWFIKAVEYIPTQSYVTIGFVATSSITQGKQVYPLWNILYEKGVEITFAYNSFKWYSKSKGKAQVAVIILGLNKNSKKQKRLFLTENGGVIELNPNYISPYLAGSKKILPIVKETPNPINGFPKIRLGTTPIDGGNYIFSVLEKNEFLIKEPDAKPYFRKYISGDDFLNKKHRYILCLENIKLDVLKKLPNICKRMELVKKFRRNKGMSARKIKDMPTLFHNTVLPNNPFLVFSRVSSEKRKYIQIGYVQPPIVPSDAVSIVENASLELFGLLTSYMHMIWLNNIGGKLETRFRYSGGLVYNTFPLPTNGIKTLEKLKPYAQQILDIRDVHSNSTLIDLYNDLTMPTDLRKAHEKLDRAVEKLYREKPFKSDQERLEFLLEQYANMISQNNYNKK